MVELREGSENRIKSADREHPTRRRHVDPDTEMYEPALFYQRSQRTAERRGRTQVGKFRTEKSRVVTSRQKRVNPISNRLRCSELASE